MKRAFVLFLIPFFGLAQPPGPTNVALNVNKTTGAIAGNAFTLSQFKTANSIGGGGSAVWGEIGGTLSAQTDLQDALNLKAPLASPTFTGTPILSTAATATAITGPAATALVLNGGTSLQVVNLSNSGVVASGTVSGLSGINRSDAGLTVRNGSGTGHALIDVFQTAVGSAGGEESSYNFSARDSGGTALSTGSVSNVWADAGPSTYKSMIRIHGVSATGGSNSDARFSSGHGIVFFSTSDTYLPGSNVFELASGSLKVTGNGVPGVGSFWNNTNRLFVGGDTGGIFIQNAANSATNIGITDAGVTTIRGAAIAPSFTVNGGTPTSLSIYTSSNRLILQPGSGGYLFQNSDNSATNITVTDAGAVSFRSGQTVTATTFAGALTGNATTATSATTAGTVTTAAQPAITSLGTLTSLTNTGLLTQTGATVRVATAMGALAVDVTKGVNTKSISAPSTITFTGSPTAGQTFYLEITADSGGPYVVTLPSDVIPDGATSALASYSVAASSTKIVGFKFVSGSTYALYNNPPLTTGTGSTYVLATAPTLVAPVLGTVAAGSILTNATGLPEAGMALTDITTNNATSSKHGFLPKLSNDAATYLNGVGGYTTPAGSGDMVLASVQTVTGAKTFGTIGGAVGKFILAGSTSGSTTVNAAAIAGTTTTTMPNADSTLPIFTQQVTFAGPTSARTYTLPDAAATLARTDAANTFTGASTASAWVLTSPTITTKISPTTDDGAPLGDTTHNFSDLFLASGGVLNFANSNVVVTHSSGILTMGTGELRITTPGTNAASVPTLGSTNTLTNKIIDFGVSMASDDTYVGTVRSGLNNSGGVTQWDTVYLNGSSAWVIADANGSGTYPARGLAVATASNGNAVTVITRGTVRNDAWSWTPGGTIYLSTTAGGLTQTPPSTTGDKVQVIGYALDADTMAVEIGTDYGTSP